MADDVVKRLRRVAEGKFDSMSMDLLAEASDEIERLRRDMTDMADWLVAETGYPADMGADLPLPESWRTLVEDAHMRNSDIDSDGLYRDEEGGQYG